MTASIITPTTTMKYAVIVENVLEKLSEVIPHVGDMIECEHRAELLHLYDHFDILKIWKKKNVMKVM